MPDVLLHRVNMQKKNRQEMNPAGFVGCSDDVHGKICQK